MYYSSPKLIQKCEEKIGAFRKKFIRRLNFCFEMLPSDIVTPTIFYLTFHRITNATKNTFAIPLFLFSWIEVLMIV